SIGVVVLERLQLSTKLISLTGTHTRGLLQKTHPLPSTVLNVGRALASLVLFVSVCRLQVVRYSVGVVALHSSQSCFQSRRRVLYLSVSTRLVALQACKKSVENLLGVGVLLSRLILTGLLRLVLSCSRLGRCLLSCSCSSA